LSWRRIDAGRARRAIVALLCVFAALAPGAVARGESQPGVVELPLPRPPAPGEDVWLQLRVGPLPRGTEIRVSTADGVLVGTASPFGAPRSQGAATYTIPLPPTAIVRGSIRLRLDVDQAGAPSRAAQPGEVEATLLFVPNGR
jgi:hypothetical protein